MEGRHSHNVGKCETSALFGTRVGGRNGLLQDGNDLAKDTISVLAAQLAKCS